MNKPNFLKLLGQWRSALKTLAFKSPLGTYIFYRTRVLRERIALASYGDLDYIKATYKKRFGRAIDLRHPQTYTEKLQWLKLFYRNADMPVCSDKFVVRDYLTQRGYGHLLNELIGVYENADEIDFAALPQKFVAKATHGSSWNLICTDKRTLNWPAWKRIMNSWLRLNLYVFGREWNYKDQHPRIVIERFIEQDPLIDYKFMCFNGKPKYIQINNDRDGKHYVDFYDLAWNKQQVTYESYQVSNHVLDKPPRLADMIQLAKELSEPFPFARVDFYNLDSRIIFGEITFFPGGGLWPLVPVDGNHDITFGEHIQLPAPNHNLELYREIHGAGDIG